MSRALAHIETIVDIQPIDGADSIEVATILGWKVVVKKGEFQVGDKVVYVEIDSILPAKPEFDFLKERKYRIKTIKLRGQLSQGIIFPLSVLGDVNVGVGDDVTELMGVTKYDPQLLKEGSVVGGVARFPEWIRKTDEERIQNMPYILRDYGHLPFEYTEKLDGQSATYFMHSKRKYFFWKEYFFGVCSRNLHLVEETNASYWRVARTLKLESVLKTLLKTFSAQTIVLQGEIIGNGIQGNKYKVEGDEFRAFNFLVDGEPYGWEAMNIALQKYNIKSVPFLGVATLPPTMDEALMLAEDKSLLNRDMEREGIVVRNYDNGISFKIISNKYLLKNGE